MELQTLLDGTFHPGGQGSYAVLVVFHLVELFEPSPPYTQSPWLSFVMNVVGCATEYATVPVVSDVSSGAGKIKVVGVASEESYDFRPGNGSFLPH